MSIYQTRIKKALYVNGGNDTVTGNGIWGNVRLAPEGQDFPNIWSHRRKADPAKTLLPISSKWLMGLPNNIRPLNLAAKYPRIANVLALQWSKPAACRGYLNELLSDRRGNRKGFPAEVHRELKALRDYHYEMRATEMHLTLVE